MTRKAAKARKRLPIPKRRLGRTNEDVSIVGMGGFHIVPQVIFKLIHYFGAEKGT